MTPVEIRVLINVYVYGELDLVADQSQSTDQAIDCLITKKLIAIDHDNSSVSQLSKFKMTEKGYKYIKMLQDTPDPIQAWKDPRDENS